MTVDFFVTKKPARVEELAKGQTRVALRPLAWDDFGHRTSFVLSASIEGQAYVDLGEWKILDTAQVAVDSELITSLPTTFRALEQGFVSLAQDSQNYSRLAKLGVELAREVLGAIRDVSFLKPEHSLLAVPGFSKSLVRFTEAQEALRHGPAILAQLGILVGHEHTALAPSTVHFEFKCRRPHSGAGWTHHLDVAFSREHLGLKRMWAIVGSNGAGKTLLLSSLARCISGLEGEHAQLGGNPQFSKIIAVSYSPWDQFTVPSGEGHRISYVYCGLRAPGIATDQHHVDVPRARRAAVDDYLHMKQARARLLRWRQAMRSCGLDRPDSPLAAAIAGKKDLATALEQSSAGEQLAAIVTTRLLRHVDAGTLVLFDEPELHMHPGLLSGLLRFMQELLKERDAFAIVGTHSPIPLQEIPAECVRVLDLFDATTHTRVLAEQCFGGTLGEIVANAFRSRDENRNWAACIRELAQKHSKAEIDAALGGNPGLGVNMLLAALTSEE
jgi:predicted ATPase